MDSYSSFLVGREERRKLYLCRSGKAARGWTASAAILVFAAVVAAGPNDGDPWNQKPYTEWTLPEVLRVTQDSPWARSLSNKGELAAHQPAPKMSFDDSPRGRWVSGANGQLMNVPTPVPVQTPETAVSPLIAANSNLRDAVILWSSSETIRQAYFRMAALQHKADETQSKSLEPNLGDYYRITVMASHIPSMLASYRGPLEIALKKSVYLKTDVKGQKIHPARIEAALKTAQPMINFYFPRMLNGSPTIDPRTQAIEFDWTSRNGEINVTFEPRKMLRNGWPDL